MGKRIGLLAALALSCQAAKPTSPTMLEHAHGSSPKVETIAASTAVSRSPLLELEHEGSPRLILTPERLERIRMAAFGGSTVFRKIESDCKEAKRKPWGSGYEGWDWGHLVVRCALVYRATGNQAYADTAVVYLRALLDDRRVVGDGKGGEAVVRHDHGYPIRTHAFFSALGYDWLRDAPGMTDELRERVVDRLESWLDWYAESGYQRELPVSNYFTGYFLALSYAGMALSGDDPRGDKLLARAESLFADKVVPRYKKLLAGGDWPEGWQYGDGAALAMAFFVDGQRTALKRDRLPDLPWLREIVRHHTHAILPDGKTAYATGDWGSRPTRMPARALEALALVLPDSDPASAEARFLARHLRQERDDWAWLRLLSDSPTAKTTDPRGGQPSYLAKGTGLVLARSHWGKDATFVSLQSGPSVVEADHQHADQGHFEIIRGNDLLLVSAAHYGGLATINHNSILVDDRGTSLDYSPNQGAWGVDSKIARYIDRGKYVYAEADFTDAYRPAKMQYGVKRSVLRAERALVFIRPDTVVIYDRVGVTDPTFDVIWAVHSLTEPVLEASRLTVRKGQSVVEVKSLLPKKASVRVIAEPEKRENVRSPYQGNVTWANTFRVERSARGKEVRFLNIAHVGGVDFTAKRAERIEGRGVDGAIVGEGDESVAVIFPREQAIFSDAMITWKMSRTRELIVIGLAGGQRYSVTGRAIESGCELILQQARGQRLADEGGTLLVNMEGCVVR